MYLNVLAMWGQLISLYSPEDKKEYKLFPSKGIEVGIQNILEELYVWKTFTLNLNMSSVVSSSSSSRPMSEALWSSLTGRCPYDDVISSTSSISIPSESVASYSLIPCHRKSNFGSGGRGRLFPSIASVLGILSNLVSIGEIKQAIATFSKQELTEEIKASVKVGDR